MRFVTFSTWEENYSEVPLKDQSPPSLGRLAEAEQLPCDPQGNVAARKAAKCEMLLIVPLGACQEKPAFFFFLFLFKEEHVLSTR